MDMRNHGNQHHYPTFKSGPDSEETAVRDNPRTCLHDSVDLSSDAFDPQTCDACGTVFTRAVISGTWASPHPTQVASRRGTFLTYVPDGIGLFCSTSCIPHEEKADWSSSPEDPMNSDPKQYADLPILLDGKVCGLDHGSEMNSAEVYGHHGSNRVCTRIGQTDWWFYDIEIAKDVARVTYDWPTPFGNVLPATTASVVKP